MAELVNGELPGEIPAELRNNQMYMTPMRSPSGVVEDVAPNEIDLALRQGYGTLNPEREWQVSRGALGIPTTVTGRDLPVFVQRGYSTDKMGEFRAQMAELSAAQNPAMPEISLGEQIMGGYLPAVASGATFGVSDIITRALNEFEGASIGNTELGKQNAEYLRTIRDSLGAGGIAAELIGSVLTGGLSVARIGKTAAQRVGLGALEGTAAGLTSVAGRDALDDPTVTAESYLWGAGLGAVLGGGFQSLSNALTRGVARPVAQTVGDIPIEFGNGLREFADSRVARTEILPIRSGDKLLGTVELSRGIDSAYHPGSKHGISIESLNLSPDAPKGTDANVLHSLVDTFGSVASPSSRETLGDVRDVFSKYGSRHMTMDGDPWYQVTAGTLPDKIGQSSAVLALGKEYFKRTGKFPSDDEKRAFEAMEKLFDPNQGLLRKDFLEYAADKDGKISKVMGSFRKADEYIKTYKEAAEKAQSELGEKITQEGALAMKAELNDVQREILRSMTALDRIPSESASLVADKLVKSYDEIEKVIKVGNPQEAWKYLKIFRDDFKSQMESVLPSATKKSSMQFPEQVVAEYRKAFDGVNSALKSKAIMGEEGAEVFAKLDDYAERLKATSKEFDASFKATIGGKTDLAADKIQNTFDSTKPGRQLHRIDVLDRFKAEAQGFMDTVKEAQGLGVAKDIRTPDPRLFTPTLSEISKARELSENMRIIQTMKGGTGVSNLLASAVASFTPSIGFATGNPLMGVIGGQLGSAALRTVGDPMAILKMSHQLMNVETQLSKIADMAIHTGAKVVPLISRPALTSALGIKRGKDTKNPTEYINNTRERLTQLAQPGMISQTVNSLPQEAQQAVGDSLSKILNYALENTPVVKTGRQMSYADALKLDKVLLAMVNPKMALTRAVVNNDADSIKHLAVMYPLLVNKFQGILAERMDGEKLTYNQRITLQRLLGLDSTRTSLGATKLAQGVFANAASAEGGNTKGITGAPSTTGTDIQDR